MATRTVGKGDFIRPYRRVRVETLKEGASQTFKRGYPLIRSSVSDYEGDHVIVWSTDAVDLIYGFAAEDATGTTGSRIAVWIADGDAEFRGVAQDTGTIDGANVGTEYGMVIDGTNEICRVDLSDTTNKNVRVAKLLDADGTVNGYVVFKIKQYADSEQTIY